MIVLSLEAVQNQWQKIHYYYRQLGRFMTDRIVDNMIAEDLFRFKLIYFTNTIFNLFQETR